MTRSYEWRGSGGHTIGAKDLRCRECGQIGTVGQGLCKHHYNVWHWAVTHPKPERFCRCGKSMGIRKGFCSDECRLAHRRELYRANPGPVLAAIGRWNARNKGWWHQYRVNRDEVTVEKVNSLEVFERDGWRCQLCRRAIRRDAAPDHPLAAVLDHIIPLSVGGTHEYRNVQAAHRVCNNRKGNRVLGHGEQLRLIA